MNRNESLQFIRDNSRCIKSVLVNPVKKWEKDENYSPNHWEQRVGNNGSLFMLNDFGKHGWEIYFVSGSIEIAKTLHKFCEYTGARDINFI